MMNLAIILVAAGSGSRFGGAVPKQYAMLAGKPVMQHAVDRLHAIFPDAVMVLVRDPAHQPMLEACCTLPLGTLLVDGGATRQASVKAGLELLAGKGITHVLIHDAARPFPDATVCRHLIDRLATHKAVIPVLPVTDTIKRAAGGIVQQTIEREGLYAVQTPQAFDYDTLLALHAQAIAEGWDHVTDDAGLCEHAHIPVATVTGAACTFKLTTSEDMAMAEHWLNPLQETRTGMGYDVHRLLPFPDTHPEAARHIRLGGINIPHTHYLEGHSDADVVLHALTDAILGAIAQGDIGQHFPPSDNTYRQMDSAVFLQHAARLMQQTGGRLVNADMTIIGERPKISPYRDSMRERIAALLQVETHRISVKATTTERLGFTGRKEGLAVQAVVTVALSTSNHTEN
jgi:2-C-methyl-D-erythritol 4-phosphate cytidylyltransferase / 2-C-methyl-D-erythritol 2,4-cyclodiphosphate synthase